MDILDTQLFANPDNQQHWRQTAVAPDAGDAFANQLFRALQPTESLPDMPVILEAPANNAVLPAPEGPGPADRAPSRPMENFLAALEAHHHRLNTENLPVSPPIAVSQELSVSQPGQDQSLSAMSMEAFLMALSDYARASGQPR
jgi:hypothetical protein